MFNYCPKCHGKGYIPVEYYDENIPELEGEVGEPWIKFCDKRECTFSQELKLKIYHPVKYFITHLKVYKKLKVLSNPNFWSDLEYTFRKVVRLPMRVIEFIPLLYNNEEFIENIPEVMEFKIKRLIKAFEEQVREYTKYGYSTTHDVARIREMKLALRFLDKYRNTYNYLPRPKYNMWLERIENGYLKYCSDITEEQQNQYNKIWDYQTKYYNKFWDIIKKRSYRWFV